MTSLTISYRNLSSQQQRVHHLFNSIFTCIERHGCLIIISYALLKAMSVLIRCFTGRMHLFFSIPAARSYTLPAVTFINIIAIIVESVELSSPPIIGPLNSWQHNSWAVSSSLPFDFTDNRLIKLSLAYLLYSYSPNILCFITRSTSLYLSYFYLLTCINSEMSNILQKEKITHRQLLINLLEGLIDVFESLSSFMPFVWMLYCSGPGLCLLLSIINTPLSAASSTRIYMVMHSCNIVILLLVLFIIGRLQKHMHATVVTCSRTIHGRNRILSHQLQKRLDYVLKRRPSVWFIFLIDRSLILSYIGSAITFSTLLIQDPDDLNEES